MKIGNLILKPVVTEKTTAMASDNKFVFAVSLKATKQALKKEIKDAYKVDVTGISIIVVPGKQKRILGKNKYTSLSKWKKAIVTVKKGQKIEV